MEQDELDLIFEACDMVGTIIYVHHDQEFII